MRENYDMLDKSGKDRIITFAVITVLASVMAVGYDLGIYCLAEGTFFSKSDDAIEAIFGLILYMALMVIVLVAGPVVILIIDLLAYGIFSAVVFRKTNFFSEAEYILANQVLMTVILISGIVILLFMVPFCCEVLSEVTSGTEFFSGLASLVWTTICPSLFPLFFGYLLYIYPLKYKRH